MINPRDFRSEIVDVLAARFRQSPLSIADAFCVIWSIDAYAVHVACQLEIKELTFKERLISNGAWQYRILREACNASKHAIRKSTSTDVESSDKSAKTFNMDGWAWYWSNAEYQGEQICIEVSWNLDEKENVWFDGRGKPVVGGGPFLPIVPVLDLIKPSLKSISNELG
jgi:hypothetical protein